MTTLTEAQSNLRYLRTAQGGTVDGAIIIPTPDLDDLVSDPGSVVNKQYIQNYVLGGGVFSGDVLLSGNPPTDPRSAVSKADLDGATLASVLVLDPSGSSSVLWDPQPNQLAQITLGAGQTVQLGIGTQRAGSVYRLLVIQPSTGSAGGIAWAAGQFAWPGGQAPTLTQTNGAVDYFTFVSLGTKMLGFGQADFS